MIERATGAVYQLTPAGLARHLANRFDEMSKRAGNPAMAIGKKAAMGVERQRASPRKTTAAGIRARLAAVADTQSFQQQRQSDREAVVDRGILNRLKLGSGA